MTENHSFVCKNVLQNYILYLVVHCAALMLTQGKMFFWLFCIWVTWYTFLTLFGLSVFFQITFLKYIRVYVKRWKLIFRKAQWCIGNQYRFFSKDLCIQIYFLCFMYKLCVCNLKLFVQFQKFRILKYTKISWFLQLSWNSIEYSLFNLF